MNYNTHVFKFGIYILFVSSVILAICIIYKDIEEHQ